MDGEDGHQLRRNTAEIDTRAPFRSVKEAVSLFGEKVLAGELYHPHNLKKMNIKRASNENGHETRARSESVEPVRSELEKTKQRLQKAKEESEVMASCLSSLQQELEQTKRELDQLKKKDQESEKHVLVENCSKYIEIRPPSNSSLMLSTENEEEVEFQKKRYVTFAEPPCVISSAHQVKPEFGDGVFLERQASLKKKKKPFIPMIGGIFSKKKGTQYISV